MIKGITRYGVAIKNRLNEMGQTQGWLAVKVSDATGLYFDSWYLHRIMCGKASSKKIIDAINEILGISDEQ